MLNIERDTHYDDRYTESVQNLPTCTIYLAYCGSNSVSQYRFDNVSIALARKIANAANMQEFTTGSFSLGIFRSWDSLDFVNLLPTPSYQRNQSC